MHPLRRWQLLLAMSAQHVRQFLGADVSRVVPEGAGLRSGVGWELVRVRHLRRDVLDFPGADMRRDVPQRTGLRSGLWWELLRVQVRYALPAHHKVG